MSNCTNIRSLPTASVNEEISAFASRNESALESYEHASRSVQGTLHPLTNSSRSESTHGVRKVRVIRVIAPVAYR